MKDRMIPSFGVRSRFMALAVTGASMVHGIAGATVTPGTLFGDSYVVVDGGRIYSVMDVYIHCGTSKDIISGTFGVLAFPSSHVLNNGKSFAQSNGAAAASWLPTNDDGKAWDSFVTCGARVQGSDTSLAGGEAGFLLPELDTNWSPSSSGAQILGLGGGAGWYPGLGASSNTNPYSRAGYNGGSASAPGWWNTARCTTAIPGNGIVPGQSLSNYWMIGRFSIDVTGDVSDDNTLSLKFGVAGRNYASESATTFTTFTGSTQVAGRFQTSLTFAQGLCPWPACPSDQDGSREVDSADVALVLMDFGLCTNCPSDRDANGFVDTADLALVLLDFGSCEPCPCGPGWCQ